MGSAPFIEPTNKIVVAGSNVDRRGYTTSGTVTNLIPGRLVKKGASDSLIVIGDDTGPNIGWIGYEDAFGPDRPVNITTAYATAKNCDVLSGPGTILVAYSETAAVTKGDYLCAGSDGKIKKMYPGGGVQTMVIPFTNSGAAEVDTGYDLPAGAVIVGQPFIVVTTEIADATIDVGLLSSEAGGDADGFLDGVSCAAAGTIVPISWDASADADNTLGVLISSALLGGTANYARMPKAFVADGTATSITYTTNDKAVVGSIYISYIEPGNETVAVAKAEETIAAAGNIIVRSLI